MELKVRKSIARQLKIWEQADSCYKEFVLSDDAKMMHVLENALLAWKEKQRMIVWF